MLHGGPSDTSFPPIWIILFLFVVVIVITIAFIIIPIIYTWHSRNRLRFTLFRYRLSLELFLFSARLVKNLNKPQKNNRFNRCFGNELLARVIRPLTGQRPIFQLCKSRHNQYLLYTMSFHRESNFLLSWMKSLPLKGE